MNSINNNAQSGSYEDHLNKNPEFKKRKGTINGSPTSPVEAKPTEGLSDPKSRDTVQKTGLINWMVGMFKKNVQGDTLVNAIKKQDYKTAKVWLTDLGANPNDIDQDSKNSALGLAVCNKLEFIKPSESLRGHFQRRYIYIGNPDLVQLLLDKGAQADMPYSHQSSLTPFKALIQILPENHKPIAKMLLDAQGKENIPQISLEKRSDYLYECVKYFEHASQDLNQGYEGYKCYYTDHYVSYEDRMNDYIDLIKMLLKEQANPNTKHEKKCPVIKLAILSGAPNLVETLLEWNTKTDISWGDKVEDTPSGLIDKKLEETKTTIAELEDLNSDCKKKMDDMTEKKELYSTPEKYDENLFKTLAKVNSYSTKNPVFINTTVINFLSSGFPTADDFKKAPFENYIQTQFIQVLKDALMCSQKQIDLFKELQTKQQSIKSLIDANGR